MRVIGTPLVLFLSGAVTLAGQPGPTRTPQAWQIAVDTHVPGQADDPLRTIAPWSFDEVMAAAQRTPLYDSRLARALALIPISRSHRGGRSVPLRGDSAAGGSFVTGATTGGRHPSGNGRWRAN